ncbi:hypothetical protein HanLR1_Chr08g0285901 [Helianthus annuus]|nr:hypothetical protein HanHA89_Chr08g0305071 [Helianthus annuus]KAJ0719810.1 hypothetical protein HanLR1_Chr08g0285901 [Helianthus annuus]
MNFRSNYTLVARTTRHNSTSIHESNKGSTYYLNRQAELIGDKRLELQVIKRIELK